MTKLATKHLQFYRKIFEHKWRWRIKTDEGRIIACSSEAFKDKKEAQNNLLQVHEFLIEYLNQPEV